MKGANWTEFLIACHEWMPSPVLLAVTLDRACHSCVPAELQKQVSSAKSRANAAEQAAAVATAQLASAHAQLEKSEQRAAALVVAEQQLQAQLRQAEECHQQALDRLAAEAAHKDAAMAALQCERDSLLADQQQLVQAVAEQQAALSAQLPEAELAGDESHEAVTPRAATPPACSPGPPSLDVIRLLRDQKEALQAQHEATVEVRRPARCGHPCGQRRILAGYLLKHQLVDMLQPAM